MKRLRYLVHLVIVSISIVLVAVNPAAACRLLKGRCSACCYVPTCDPVSCSDAAKPAAPREAVPSTEASPSDAVPGAIDQANERMPPIGTSTPVEIALPQAAPETTNPHADLPPAVLTFGEPSPPAASAPATRPHSISEPPPLATPIDALQRPVTTASPPDVNSAAALPTSEDSQPVAASPALRPAPQTLTPLQGVRAPASAAANNTPSTPSSIAPPVTVKRPIETPMPETSGAAGNLPRTLHQPVAPPTTPVTPPAFPKADDDPFAPKAATAPKAPATAPAPAEDDPFAPLPPAGTPKPSTPIPAEPTTIRIADALLPAADGRLPVREWRDDSGKFSVKARLVLILDGKVRLLKETGRTTTVELSRLSAADRAYVAEVVSRYGQDLTGLDKLAAR